MFIKDCRNILFIITEGEIVVTRNLSIRQSWLYVCIVTCHQQGTCRNGMVMALGRYNITYKLDSSCIWIVLIHGQSVLFVYIGVCSDTKLIQSPLLVAMLTTLAWWQHVNPLALLHYWFIILLILSVFTVVYLRHELPSYSFYDKWHSMCLLCIGCLCNYLVSIEHSIMLHCMYIV